MILRAVDLETTGLLATDKVVEAGWADLVFDGSSGVVYGPHGVLFDPGVPIPPEVSAVHHIIDADVIGAPRFVSCDDSIGADGVDIWVAHNARFEQQWLQPQKPWVCTFKCSLRVWPQAPSHSNQALRYWLRPPGLDRSIAAVAHRAPPDAYVTAFTMRELLREVDLAQLLAWTLEPALLVRCGFGKHQGTPWAEIPKDYLRWMLQQDFGEDERHSVALTKSLTVTRSKLYKIVYVKNLYSWGI